MSRRGIRLATPLAFESLKSKDRSRAVIVVPRCFYPVILKLTVFKITMEIVKSPCFQPNLAPHMPNGKPLHVSTVFIKAFNNTAVVKILGYATKIIVLWFYLLLGIWTHL